MENKNHNSQGKYLLSNVIKLYFFFFFKHKLCFSFSSRPMYVISIYFFFPGKKFSCSSQLNSAAETFHSTVKASIIM